MLLTLSFYQLFLLKYMLKQHLLRKKSNNPQTKNTKGIMNHIALSIFSFLPMKVHTNHLFLHMMHFVAYSRIGDLLHHQDNF